MSMPRTPAGRRRSTWPSPKGTVRWPGCSGLRGAGALLQDEQGRTADDRSGEQEIEERRSLRKLRWIVRGLSALPFSSLPFTSPGGAGEACKPSRRRSSS